MARSEDTGTRPRVADAGAQHRITGDPRVPYDRGRWLLAAERARHPAALRGRAAAMHLDALHRLLRLQVHDGESVDDAQAVAFALDLAGFGEVPGAARRVRASTPQQVEHVDGLLEGIESDFPPVHHRVR